MEAFKDCGVCYLSFDTKERAPRVLSCGHSLCSSCLVFLIKTKNQQKCPFDNLAFTNSQRSLDSFSLNYAILACFEDRDKNICKSHPEKKLNRICLTDKTKICSECVISEKHHGHPTKKIKELKVQGAKVKQELQNTLVKINDYEQEKEEEDQRVRKVFISAIQDQFKEIKKIIALKESELVQQANNLFDLEKKNDCEKVLALRQQIDANIKDITHASQDNGDLTLLNKEYNSDQLLQKSQLFKAKSSRVYNKALEMKNLLLESLAPSKGTMMSLQLSDQEFIKEICIPLEGGQLSQEEFTNLSSWLRSLRFTSDFDITKTPNGLIICIEELKPSTFEMREIDLEAVEKVNIQSKRYDILTEEKNLNVISSILHRLKKSINLEVVFTSAGFSNNALLWLENNLSDHAHHLKSLYINLERCKITDQCLQTLCSGILSKAINLQDLYLYFDSSQARNSDLNTLAKSIEPLCKNLEEFVLGLDNNPDITDDGIKKIFEIIKSMTKLKVFQLGLSKTKITDKSLRFFGKSVLSSLNSLHSLILCLNDCTISDFSLIFGDFDGLAGFGQLPDLKTLELYLCRTQVQKDIGKKFLEKLLPNLRSLESLTFLAKSTQIHQKTLWRIHEISESLKEKKEGVKAEVELIRFDSKKPIFLN